MIESKYGVHYKPEFREPMLSEFDVRENGGVPTDVTFENGVGSFDGSTSKIVSEKNLSGTFSVRLKVNITNLSLIQYLFDFRDNGGTGYCYINATSGVLTVSGTKYINGVPNTVVTAGDNIEIIITGLPIEASSIYIFSRYSSTQKAIGTCDLFEIYEGTLTAEEVKNLYKGKRYRDIAPQKREQISSAMNVNNFINLTGGLAYTTFSGASPTGFSATSDGGGTHGAATSEELVIITGRSYSVSFTANLISGTLPTVCRLATSKTGSAISNIYAMSNGSNEVTFVATGDATIGVVQILSASSAVSFEISDFSIKQISNSYQEILNIDSRRGAIYDNYGNTITNTDVEVVRDGEIYVEEYNGSTSVLTMSSDLQPASVTLSCWVKTNTIIGVQGLIGNVASSGQGGYGLWIFNDDIRLLWDYGASVRILSVSSIISENKWIHIAGCITTGDQKIFVNGEEEKSSSHADSIDYSASKGLEIGAINSGGFNGVSGVMSNSRIYQGALSAEEISQLYTNEKHFYNK